MSYSGLMSPVLRARLIVWGGLLVLWEVVALQLGAFFLPRPGEVLIASATILFNGDILTLVTTLRQMAGGFALACFVGIGLGVLIGSSRLADGVLGMYARALFVIPLEAILPFLILLVGTGLPYRVTVVFLFALFSILFNTAAGVRSVNPALIETAAAFCAPRLAVIRTVILPAALPYLLSGMRIGLANAFKGAIIAELWVIVGTGRKLVELGTSHHLSEYFAFIVWIVGIGIFCYEGMRLVERRLTCWNRVGMAPRRRGVQ
ncbi:MAG: ABC transporter permease subunit [Anaerolineales bacterium]|nr:ABC transporter permease subunit [Anaerolineales bacterium]